MMVTMRNPYTGGTVTVSVSMVERQKQRGFIVTGEEPETVSAVPPGEPAVEETPAETGHTPQSGGAPKGNASRAAWRDYAESLGVNTEGMTRADIREAVDNQQD